MRDLIVSYPAAPTSSRNGVARRAAVAILMMLACVGLAACDDGESDDQAAATTTSATAAYPVTIASKFGSATITQEPQRVVTLDNQSTDDALALGVVPVAIAKVTYVPGDMQEWTKAALAGRKAPQLLDTDTGIPYERLAALRPDLILASHAFLLDKKSVHDRLSRIAPTVHFAEGSLTDDWQTTMQRVGQALGQEDRAGELVADAERDLAAVRTRTPEFEGKTVNFFNNDPSGLYTINDTSDYSIRLLAKLGLRLSPQVARLKGDGGRAVISAERYDVLESDLLLGTSVVPKTLAALGRNKLFNRLDTVRDGHYVPLPIGPATSMAFPSLLSVRYATMEVVPKLEEAIKRTADN